MFSVLAKLLNNADFCNFYTTASSFMEAVSIFSRLTEQRSDSVPLREVHHIATRSNPERPEPA